MPATAQPVKLLRANPVDGHKDGKLHCLNEADWWAQVDGVVFIVENRDGVCSVTPDLDLLHRLASRNDTYGPEFHAAVMAWLSSAEYDNASATVVTLRRARATLADIVTGPGWPAARDAYRALLDWARGECWFETILLAADFPGLLDSPWLFDDLNTLVDFVLGCERYEPGIYLFTGTYTGADDDAGTFDGTVTITPMTRAAP